MTKSMVEPLCYGIVGDGRAATHFQYYISLMKGKSLQWSRKTQKETGLSAIEALQDADVILVLISDMAIETWINTHRNHLKPKAWIHASGSLVTDLAQGVHPLYMLGDQLYDLEKYQSIPMITELGNDPFSQWFPTWPNPHQAIDPNLKALYHALCVVSGNFTSMLWQKVFSQMEQHCKLPGDILLPYLESVTHSLSVHKEKTKATGPISRGDQITIERNLEALKEIPELKSIYESFAKVFGS
ncbi:MAG: DUF2520 domain-containing protein [Bdellovibrionales bacterium]|nr:DUF2520 domain-containing protein [Bdellovibrionales bacterium]